MSNTFKKLHDSLDQLMAAFLDEHKGTRFPSRTSLLEFAAWAAKKAEDTCCQEGEKHAAETGAPPKSHPGYCRGRLSATPALTDLKGNVRQILSRTFTCEEERFEYIPEPKDYMTLFLQTDTDDFWVCCSTSKTSPPEARWARVEVQL